MGFIIEDGRGTSKKAGVNRENRLMTHAVTESLEHHTNQIEGLTFHLLFQVTPSANSCFVYIKNTNTHDITAEGILLRTSADEQIEIYLKTTGNPSGTTATPANLNAGSPITADGVFLVGDDITGLTPGELVERFYIKGDETSTYYNFEQDIIVPPNQTFCLHPVNGNIDIAGTLVFFYHNPNV